MFKNLQNPEGHQNPIIGSEVTAILLGRQILHIGGASAGEGLRLQPAQKVFFLNHFHFENCAKHGNNVTKL